MPWSSESDIKGKKKKKEAWEYDSSKDSVDYSESQKDTYKKMEQGYKQRPGMLSWAKDLFNRKKQK